MFFRILIVLIFSSSLSIWLYTPVFSAESSSVKELVLKKNRQVLIDFAQHPQIRQLYKSGKLQLGISHNSEIRLNSDADGVHFWYPKWKNIVTWNLLVEYGDVQNSIPIRIDEESYYRDFSVQDDMFQLSLQKKALSCESSATSDILATFLWKSVHEDTVIAKLPRWDYFNKLPDVASTDNKVWGNPEAGFVGYIQSVSGISASQRFMTWYGVYEPPIAEVYESYWLHTQIFNRNNHSDSITPEIHLRFILEKLKSWSMVQLWGDWCTTWKYDDGVLAKKADIKNSNMDDFISAKNWCYNVWWARELRWQYKDSNGNFVNHTGLDGQHAFILLWWKWNIHRPSYIKVWDTDTGYHVYPTAEWMRKWERMDYRSVIVTEK